MKKIKLLFTVLSVFFILSYFDQTANAGCITCTTSDEGKCVSWNWDERSKKSCVKDLSPHTNGFQCKRGAISTNDCKGLAS